MADEPKKYKLNAEETKNVKFRRVVMDYINDAVHEDLGRYLETQVLPRLKLQGKKIEISQDGEWISVLEEEPKIVTKK